MSVKYLGGYLYYIIFVDDLSYKTWIFNLKCKDKAFEMFEDFKALIENQRGNRIKVFKSDNGGEYISNEVINFLKKAKIKIETIIPYNPEQNGMLKERIGLSWKFPKPCCMIKSYRSSFREETLIQWYTFKTGLLIKPWVTRLSKNFSQV